MSDAGLIAEERSCMDCSPDRLCDECVNKEFYQIDEESDDSEDEDADEIIDDDYLGCSDDDEEDISDDEDVHDSCSNFGPEDIVWGKYRRKFFPAKIVSFNQLPEKVQAGLGKSRKADTVIVQWYGEDNYSWVKTRNIDELSENKCDSARATLGSPLLHMGGSEVRYAMSDSVCPGNFILQK